MAECCLSKGFDFVNQRDRAAEGGAKMGQTVRQTMPFNAKHAFVHVVVICAQPQ